MDNPFTPINTQASTSQGDNPFVSVTPQSVGAAKDIGNQDYNGECQRFAEQATYGKTGIFPSASTAWQAYAQSGEGKQGLTGIKPGDLIYFNDPSQPDGHVGIFNGGNKMISATYNGVQESDLTDWLKSTGQQLLGHVSVRGGYN